MATTTASSYPLVRERNVILATLLLLAAGAWALLVWQWATSDGDMSLTMGMGAPLFIAIWVAMMVAMMFPTAAPMVLTFARVHETRKAQGRPFVSTWVFTASYLVVWTLFGMLAYGVAVGLGDLADQSAWLMNNAARIGGGVLILAGLYQLSPLKYACLSKCRTPLSFILSSWRDGYAGSFRMGMEHGLYCLGCCWMLFVILFPLGVMNVGAMALITLLIFAEKSTPIGRQTAQFASLGLIAYGALVVFVPDLLPTMMSMDGGSSPSAGMS
jgi:predicted metal-binding membrane protein